MNLTNGKIIVLFDGVCNFCNKSVNFILKRDKKNIFIFAALQSDAGRKLLNQFGLSAEDFDSFMLIKNNKVLMKTSASLNAVKEFPGLWKLLYIFIIVPPFIRNIFYDIIAKNRYRWFGKREVCRIPSPEETDKFLQ